MCSYDSDLSATTAQTDVWFVPSVSPPSHACAFLVMRQRVRIPICGVCHELDLRTVESRPYRYRDQRVALLAFENNRAE